MTDQELKIRMLELAAENTGSATINANNIGALQLKSTLQIAQEYYAWVAATAVIEEKVVAIMDKPEPVEPVSND